MKYKGKAHEKRHWGKMIFLIVVALFVALVGVYLFLKYRPLPKFESYYLDMEYLGEVHVESYEGYLIHERTNLHGFDENDFSLWTIFQGQIEDVDTQYNQSIVHNLPYINFSEYDIDFETEMVAVSVNRKLQSLMIDGESVYEGMGQLDSLGRRIPQPPVIGGVLESEYFPNTMFLYRITPKTPFRSYDLYSPNLYNEWNRIAE